MKRRTALIKGSTLVGFDDLARRCGNDGERLMAVAGLSDIYLRQPDMYLPFYSFVRLLDIAARETGRPLFGAELGFSQGIRVLGAIASSLAASATVGMALERLLAHYMLQTTGVHIRIDRLDRTAVLSADIIAPVPPGTRQIYGQICANGIALIRTLIGADWQPTEVHFPHACPADERQAYSKLFGAGIRFETPRAALVFDSDVLNVPLPEADPALHALIERELGKQALRFVEDFPLQVEATIQNKMPQGQVSLELIASTLAMSPRSLQRHLQQGGTSFQEVLDSSRRKTAEHYLLNSDLPMTEVSELLGFQGLSNFTHAFRRWHGISPRQWKKAQR